MTRLAFKTLSIAGLSLIATSSVSYAQEKQTYVYGWANERGTKVLYVSDTVRTGSHNDAAVRQRWGRALNRAGVNRGDIAGEYVSTTGRIEYTDADEAEDSRVKLVNSSKRNGYVVRLISW